MHRNTEVEVMRVPAGEEATHAGFAWVKKEVKLGYLWVGESECEGVAQINLLLWATYSVCVVCVLEIPAS